MEEHSSSLDSARATRSTLVDAPEESRAESKQRQRNSPSVAVGEARSPDRGGTKLTIFGLPKPFIGHIGVIQRNAIRSWVELGAAVEVVLFGAEAGTAEYAREMGIKHVPTIRRNGHGTPLLDDVFRVANQLAQGATMLYANCDIVFLDDLLRGTELIQRQSLADFLLIGRRTDIDHEHMIDFESPSWSEDFSRRLKRRGILAPVVCKDYFGFPKGKYAEIPAFAVGRGNWDNWMVHQAIQDGVPVVDGTAMITAAHQNHDYRHLANGRLAAYVNGDEAEENRRLAGGRHLVTGCSATWKLSAKGVSETRQPVALPFLKDLPRFAGLMSDLFLRR